jgi:outer membrane protein assembly factor BamB
MFTHRRRVGWLTSAACTMVIAALCTASVDAGAQSAAGAVGEGWPQPSADAAHSNHAVGETTLTIAKIHRRGLRPLYSIAQVPFYGSCGGDFSSPRPVVAAGRIYMYDGHRVDAYDLATGAMIWRSPEIGGTLGLQAADWLGVTTHRLIVGGFGGCESPDSSSGFVWSLDLTDGHKVWEQGFVEEPNVAVSGSTAVLKADGSDFGDPTFAAYQVDTGATIWDRGTDCGEQVAPAFVVGSHLISNSPCGTMNLSTGRTEWTKPGWFNWDFIRGDIPGVRKPSIYAKTPTHRLLALSPAGTVRWDAGVGYGTVLAAGRRSVFVVCHGGDSVCALNRLTGAPQWRYQPPTTRPGRRAVSASDFLILPNSGSFIRVADGARMNPGRDPVDFYFQIGNSRSVDVAYGRVVAFHGRNVDVYALNPL